MLSLALTGILNFYALSGYGRIPKRYMNNPTRYTINPNQPFLPNAQERVVAFCGGLLLRLSIMPAYGAPDTWRMSTE